MKNRVRKTVLRRLVAHYHLLTHIMLDESYFWVLVVNYGKLSRKAVVKLRYCAVRDKLCCQPSVTEKYNVLIEKVHRITTSRDAQFKKSRPRLFPMYNHHLGDNLVI